MIASSLCPRRIGFVANGASTAIALRTGRSNTSTIETYTLGWFAAIWNMISIVR